MGKKLKAAGGGPIGEKPDAFKDSAALLTGGAAPVKKKPQQAAGNQSASLLTGGSPSSQAVDKPVEKKPAAAQYKGQAQVRFAESTLKCIIKGISLTEVKVVAKKDQKFPGILDQAVVDIQLKDTDEIARLNGYVHALQAVEKRFDSELVSVIIRFVDEDPEKLEQLSRFIGR